MFISSVFELTPPLFAQSGRAIRFEVTNGVIFGGVTVSTTYYINSIVGTTISISTSATGSALLLSAYSGSSNTIVLSSPDEYPGPTKANINNKTWFYHEYVHSWPPSSCNNCNSYNAQYRVETTSGGGPSTSTLFVDEVRLSLREDCAFATKVVPSLVENAWINGILTPKLWGKVSLGWDHSCATDADSALFCWGRNQEGQVGDGSITDVSRPRPVSQLSSVSSFSLGRYHTCAVASGSLYCWGAFSTTSSTINYGQANPSGTLIPVKIEGIIASAVQQVACGKLHTCALDLTGQVWCFGRNYNGQLGIGSAVDNAIPAPVQSIPHSVAMMATGMKGDASCVITILEQRWCWGENNLGQFGDSTAVGRYEPSSGVPALVRIEPSGIFSIRNGLQLTIYGASSFGVSPYTICFGVQLQAQNNSGLSFDFTCSWLDPSVMQGKCSSAYFEFWLFAHTLSAIFYSAPNVMDADYPSIEDFPLFDVVCNFVTREFSLLKFFE